MSDWVKVAELKDVARRRTKVVTVGGEDIALFVVGDNVYALYDTCIHKQRSLSRGTLLKGRVICPGHQWAFDLATGWEESQERCQPSYPAKVEDGAVWILPQARMLTEPPSDATSAWTSVEPAAMGSADTSDAASLASQG